MKRHSNEENYMRRSNCAVKFSESEAWSRIHGKKTVVKNMQKQEVHKKILFSDWHT